jgi:outer membrane protein assembly factor BamB
VLVIVALLATCAQPTASLRPAAAVSAGGSLREAWRARGSGPLVAEGNGAVAMRDGVPWLMDAAGPHQPLPRGQRFAPGQDDGGAIVGSVGLQAIGLNAFDRAGGAPLWSAACFSCPVVRSADGVVVAAGLLRERDPTHGAVGLDAATGAELWRTLDSSFDPGTYPLALAEGRLLVAAGRAGVLAYDLKTGRRSWTLPLRHGDLVYASLPALRIHAGRAAILDPHESVRVVDVEDGEELWSVPWSGDTLDLALDDATLVIAGDKEVAAFDAATGEPRIRREMADRIARPLWVDGGVVYVRTTRDPLARVGSADEITALSLATGDPIARRAVGGSQSAVLSRGGGAPPALLVDVADDWIVALVWSSEPEPPHAADVCVRVRVPGGAIHGPLPPLGGLRVRVGDVVETTDADGAVCFRAYGTGVTRVDLVDVSHFGAVLECPIGRPAFVDFGSRAPSYAVETSVVPTGCPR